MRDLGTAKEGLLLAAPPLDAHHVEERVSADGPLGTGLAQVAGRGHEAGAAARHQCPCHVAQRAAVPVQQRISQKPSEQHG